MMRTAVVFLAALATGTASAQWPMFDPDDSVDPRATGRRPVFISRLVIGAGSNMSGDGFRPLGRNVGYVHLANSFSWRSMQFDYKRSQMQAEDGAAAVWLFRQPPVDSQPGIGSQQVAQVPVGPWRQTRPATPKSKDTLNAAWYWPVGAGGGIPVMLRSRVTFSTQPIETQIGSGDEEVTSGRERTFAFDTDTWFRIAGRDVFGSLAYSRTSTRSNTESGLGDRDESALTYTNRFPALSVTRARILIRPTLTVGGISNRDASAVNLVKPAIEIFRPFARSGANLHVIYSPQWTAEETRWKTTHQIAVFIDRALFVKRFGGGRRGEPSPPFYAGGG